MAQIVETDQQGGGCGHNLAVDIRKLDSSMPVEAIGLVGADADGQFLMNKVRDAGIDISQFVTVEGAQTSFTDVMSVSGSGRRTFFHHPGSHDYVTPDHFALEQCSGRILHLGLLGVHAKMDAPWKEDANGWVCVLRIAQALGIHTNLELVSIEPEKIRTIALPCLPYINTLIVNDYELSALADTSIHNDDGNISLQRSIEAANHVLIESEKHNGALSLVVMHCPEFAVAVTASGDTCSLPGFKVNERDIVSTVGAGDAFAAGMLYGIHEQWSTERSLELAHATAAASLRSSNTVGSVESVEKCLAYAHGL